ncbi:putative glyoxalase superfamily protein PhnB [Algoriphagus ratkowskyi]|uniref:Putative glyoxalase superfamily protein PhnB n=1 Tax=Algoriphagus ratkowskyi TaxID=57028 RepID=A0A2W7S618_9BACT|nr:VOC family protein [Algoriphagus ratkowskyi]PZX58335.1 putative glyoxalase superfamily protein PhnB [Algoriphagus ratkowskyi]TXD77791.1 VOC family protein [Algoriphagus ratkowskyi]
MILDLKVPADYQAVMPYLILKDAASFIKFAEEVFSAKVVLKEMRDKNTIMHAEIIIGESTVMIAEATPDYEIQNSGLFVYVKDADAAFELAIELGAVIIMNVSNQPYGRSGGIKDPFGNTYWITSVSYDPGNEIPLTRR